MSKEESKTERRAESERWRRKKEMMAEEAVTFVRTEKAESETNEMNMHLHPSCDPFNICFFPRVLGQTRNGLCRSAEELGFSFRILSGETEIDGANSFFLSLTSSPRGVHEIAKARDFRCKQEENSISKELFCASSKKIILQTRVPRRFSALRSAQK